MSTGDCLLNCLREVRLERFHRNFVERGLFNCEQLSSLLVDDYSRFGVVSNDDRRRLFQLVQIIQSVQADGVYCQHGGVTVTQNNKRPGQQLQPAGNSHIDKDTRLTNTSDLPKNNNVPPRKSLPLPVPEAIEMNGNVDKKCPAAPIRTFIKPIINDIHYRVQYERPAAVKIDGRLHAVQETKVISKQPTATAATATCDKDSTTPVFRCRKTLNFSDSDLMSDTEEAARHFISKTANAGSCNSSAGAASAVRPTLQPPHTTVTEIVPSPRAFVVKSGNKHKDRTNIVRHTASTDSHSVPTTHRSVPTTHTGKHSDNQLQGFSHATQSHANNGRLSVACEEPHCHAYFPMSVEPPTYIQQVYHTAGYNYGVPRNELTASVSCEAEKDVADVSGSAALPCTDKICVCVRKRPRTLREQKRNEADIVKVRGHGMVVVEELKVAVDLTKYMQQHVMTFDIAFDETSRNVDVYERTLKSLVASLFTRKSAVCFAFGQTGAGKTHTLLGSKNEPGLYQLAGSDLFTMSRMHTKSFGPLHIWASYYEIYCGHLYDLLNKRKRLHVRENGRQKVCITGLMENEVTDIKSLVKVVSYGNSYRSRGVTGVNPHSSRSHALLQIEVRDGMDDRIGRLTFIDLAGSERAADAVNTDRQTRIEGAEINQSLLALKECIRSIDQEAGHTPYRQSKLTHILRESFLGQSQTVMIANITPTQTSCDDTLNTLRYADRVKELTKEAAKRANNNNNSPSTSTGNTGLYTNHSTGNTGHPSFHQPATSSPPVSSNIPQHPSSPPTHSSTPPTSNLQHSPARRPFPSLFHPSNIQFSSTPMKCNVVGQSHSAGQVLNGTTDESVSGHRITPGSPPHDPVELDLRLGRISPIDVSPDDDEVQRNDVMKGLEDLSGFIPHSDIHNGQSETFDIVDDEKVSRDCEASPCSCRSLNSSLKAVAGGNSLGYSIPTSDEHLSRALFAETKACMENARANIREFLQSEKTGKQLASGDNKLIKDNGKSVVCDAVSAVNCLLSGGSRRQVRTDGRSTVSDIPGMTLRQNGPGCLENDGDGRKKSSRDNSARSWADIFEKSGGDGMRSAGSSVGPEADVSVETDVAMLETLKSKIRELKRRQEQLEHDQLVFTHGRAAVESKYQLTVEDNVDSVQAGPQNIETNCVNFTAADSRVETLNKQGISGCETDQTVDWSADKQLVSSGYQSQNSAMDELHRPTSLQSCNINTSLPSVNTSLPYVNTNVPSKTVNTLAGRSLSDRLSSFPSHSSINNVSTRLVSSVTCDSDISLPVRHLSQPSSVLPTRQHTDTFPITRPSNLTSDPVSLPFQDAIPSQNALLRLAGVPLSASSLADSAFKMVARPTELRTDAYRTVYNGTNGHVAIATHDYVTPTTSAAGNPVTMVTNRLVLTNGPVATSVNVSPAVTVTSSNSRPTVECIVADTNAKATRLVHHRTFVPIEPCPITPRDSTIDSKTSLDSAIDNRQHNQTTERESTDPRQFKPTSNTVSQSDSQNSLAEEDIANRQSQSLLICSHEEQLTAVTQLCKQEMCLLMDVKAGNMNFEHYVENVQKILLTKLKIVGTLHEHVTEFR